MNHIGELEPKNPHVKSGPVGIGFAHFDVFGRTIFLSPCNGGSFLLKRGMGRDKQISFWSRSKGDFCEGSKGVDFSVHSHQPDLYDRHRRVVDGDH